MARLLRPTRDAAPSLRQYPIFFGEIARAQVLLLAGGMGARRAGAAAEALLHAWPPDLLVIAGVAGALSPSLQVGDVVAADAVDAEGEILIPPVVPKPAKSALSAVGTLLSIDRVLITAEEKRKAHASNPLTLTPSPPRLAVEMETAAAARVAQARGVPWAAVRAISDAASESLPLDFNRLRGADGGLPIARVALAALARPRCIPGLLRLGRNTSLAAEALARYLADWLEGEAPP